MEKGNVLWYNRDIIYISECDFLKGNKTIYHVDKVLRETGTVIDDGLHVKKLGISVEELKHMI